MSVLFMLGALTGCQQSSGASPSANPSGASTSNAEKREPVSLTIWYENDQKIGDALQQQLDKLPDVKVKVQRKDKMTDALKLVGNDPQSAPDLFFFAHDKTGLYAEMGILAPITDFISQDAFSDFIPMTLKAGTYKDTLYQLPIYFETQMFMYNKKLMSTPPKTTDDLLKFAQKNTKNGAYGFVEQHSTAYYAVSWMHAFGGYIIDKDAQPGLNLQGTVDSLKYHKPFIKYQPADGDYNTMTALFKEGKAASTINLPNLAVDAKQSGIDVGFAPLPVVNATGKPLSPYAGVQGVYVLKSSESGKKDAIAAVLQELAKPEAGILRFLQRNRHQPERLRRRGRSHAERPGHGRYVVRYGKYAFRCEQKRRRPESGSRKGTKNRAYTDRRHEVIPLWGDALAASPLFKKCKNRGTL